MDTNKIHIEYTDIIEIQLYEEHKHIEKDFDNIPLNVIKAIETLLEKYIKLLFYILF